MYKSILYKNNPLTIGYSYSQHHYSTNMYSKQPNGPKRPKDPALWIVYLLGFYFIHRNHR
jgi:hypothetical protein